MRAIELVRNKKM